MSISQEQIFKTYIADSSVDVHYYLVAYNKMSLIILKNIIVMPDNRPLYKTRTKELDEAIIALIQNDLTEKKEETKEKECITSV